MQAPDSAPRPVSDQPAIDLVLELCRLLETMISLLEEEFLALSNHDISGFETLQPQKELLIERITAIKVDDVASRLDSAQEHPEGPALANLQTAWDSLQALGRTGNTLQKRNEILINRKLGVVRDAIRALDPAAQNTAQVFYDLRGKITDKL